jgi:GR25 family glycosyltransferase involved in LPS biosynthesis
LESLNSARQSKIEASSACGPTEEDHSQIGKADEEDQFCKVAASPNLPNQPACGITMKMKLSTFLFLLFFFSSQIFGNEGNYRIESVITGYDGEKKLYLLTLFLPYNPTVISYTGDPKVKAACSFWWPKGPFFLEQEHQGNACDLVWIDKSRNELDILYNAVDKIQQAKVIYTSTHADTFYNLKSFLEASGYTMLGHWYWEGKEGEAMFIKSNLFYAAMNTLHYSHFNFCVESSSQNNLEQHFKKANHKSPIHKMEEIDFIYMINLDERPQKFEQTFNELSRFGIYPYRFSAVNGWKITTEAINQVGVKFSSDFGQQQFLGSIYREIDGVECLGNEILRPNGETFFCLGMSRGAIGIVLSHLSILQDAYDSGFQTIWIMEDDVEAIENPRQMSKIIQKLDALIEDWDILFTDIDTKDRNGNHVPCRAIGARPNVKIEPLSFFFDRFYSISSDLSKIGMRYGAYSMIVRRSGMKKILDYYKTYGIFIPYDMDIWLNPDLEMYSVTRDIVSHRPEALTDNSHPNYLKEEIQ